MKLYVIGYNDENDHEVLWLVAKDRQDAEVQFYAQVALEQDQDEDEVRDYYHIDCVYEVTEADGENKSYQVKIEEAK